MLYESWQTVVALPAIFWLIALTQSLTFQNATVQTYVSLQADMVTQTRGAVRLWNTSSALRLLIYARSLAAGSAYRRMDHCRRSNTRDYNRTSSRVCCSYQLVHLTKMSSRTAPDSPCGPSQTLLRPIRSSHALRTRVCHILHSGFHIDGALQSDPPFKDREPS